MEEGGREGGREVDRLMEDKERGEKVRIDEWRRKRGEEGEVDRRMEE